MNPTHRSVLMRREHPSQEGTDIICRHLEPSQGPESHPRAMPPPRREEALSLRLHPLSPSGHRQNSVNHQE